MSDVATLTSRTTSTRCITCACCVGKKVKCYNLKHSEMEVLDMQS